MRKLSKHKKPGTRFKTNTTRLRAARVPEGIRVTGEQISSLRTDEKAPTRIRRPFLPKRDPLDIDKEVLAVVLKELIPKVNMSRVFLDQGLVNTGKIKFRFSDVQSLLYQLHMEGFFDCDKNTLKAVELRYNRIVNKKGYDN